MSIKIRDLPAGLGHTGNHAGIGKLAESDTGEMEATHECVAAAGELAAVHQTYGRSVTRQHRQSDVVALSLQLGAEVCVASRDSCLFLISFDPAFLSHNFVGADSTLFSFIVKLNFVFFCFFAFFFAFSVGVLLIELRFLVGQRC